MDANYLQDIVDKLSSLQPSQYRDAEQLKIHAVEALKQLFPGDGLLALKMDHLNFKPSIGVSDQFNRDQFLNAKNTLASMIAAKIVVLTQLPVKKSIIDIEQNNQVQASIISQQEAIISQYKTAVRAADKKLLEQTAIIADLKADINSLNAEVRKKRISSILLNGVFWGFIGAFLIGVPLWSFDQGKDLGYQRVDEERLQLKDSVKVLNKAINYMRHNSDSALNILSHMPYDKMTLDTLTYRKVQTNIEGAGAVLYLNINYK